MKRFITLYPTYSKDSDGYVNEITIKASVSDDRIVPAAVLKEDTNDDNGIFFASPIDNYVSGIVASTVKSILPGASDDTLDRLILQYYPECIVSNFFGDAGVNVHDNYIYTKDKTLELLCNEVEYYDFMRIFMEFERFLDDFSSYMKANKLDGFKGDAATCIRFDLYDKIMEECKSGNIKLKEFIYKCLISLSGNGSIVPKINKKTKCALNRDDAYWGYYLNTVIMNFEFIMTFSFNPMVDTIADTVLSGYIRSALSSSTPGYKLTYRADDNMLPRLGNLLDNIFLNVSLGPSIDLLMYYVENVTGDMGALLSMMHIDKFFHLYSVQKVDDKYVLEEQEDVNIIGNGSNNRYIITSNKIKPNDSGKISIANLNFDRDYVTGRKDSFLRIVLVIRYVNFAYGHRLNENISINIPHEFCPKMNPKPKSKKSKQRLDDGIHDKVAKSDKSTSESNDEDEWI